MDPNFVQHTLSDIAVRFFGYLGFILAYSTVIHGSVRAAFSMFRVDLESTWWDDAAVGVLGAFFGVALNLNALFYIAGLTDPQVHGALSEMAKIGTPAGLIPFPLLVVVCNLVTGSLVIGGRKTIVALAEDFTQGYEALKERMTRTQEA